MTSALDQTDTNLSGADAYRLFQETGHLLCLDTPPGTNVIIDGTSFSAGDRFKGIKMIPPGVHYLTYSARGKEGDMAVSTGLFFTVERGSVKVLQWSKASEEFLDEQDLDKDFVQAKTNAVLSLQYDQNLGAYPAKQYQEWRKLAYFITPQVLSRLEPTSGRIHSTASLLEMNQQSTNTSDQQDIPMNNNDSASDRTSDHASDRASDRLPGESEFAYKYRTMDPEALKRELAAEAKGLCNNAQLYTGDAKAGHTIFFSQILGMAGCGKPSDRTSYAIDTTNALIHLINKQCNRQLEQLYGEMQLAFVAFLFGQSLEAFEQWKRIIDVLCRCEQILTREYGSRMDSKQQTSNKIVELHDFLLSKEFFQNMFGILSVHLSHVPTDFFAEEIISNSFLTKALSQLQLSCLRHAQQIAPTLYKTLRSFLANFEQKFGYQCSIPPRTTAIHQQEAQLRHNMEVLHISSEPNTNVASISCTDTKTFSPDHQENASHEEYTNSVQTNETSTDHGLQTTDLLQENTVQTSHETTNNSSEGTHVDISSLSAEQLKALYMTMDEDYDPDQDDAPVIVDLEESRF